MLVVWTIRSAIVALSCAAAVTDVRRRVVPDWLTLPAVVLGLAAFAWRLHWSGVGLWALGLGAPTLPLLPPWLMGGVGGGDFKLALAFGALGGPLFGFVALCWGMAAGVLLFAAAPGKEAARDLLHLCEAVRVMYARSGDAGLELAAAEPLATLAALLPADLARCAAEGGGPAVRRQLTLRTGARFHLTMHAALLTALVAPAAPDGRRIAALGTAMLGAAGSSSATPPGLLGGVLAGTAVPEPARAVPLWAAGVWVRFGVATLRDVSVGAYCRAGAPVPRHHLPCHAGCAAGGGAGGGAAGACPRASDGAVRRAAVPAQRAR
jgi:Flp pilus assembly protein protease CpaA